jgi:hypothetical protein
MTEVINPAVKVESEEEMNKRVDREYKMIRSHLLHLNSPARNALFGKRLADLIAEENRHNRPVEYVLCDRHYVVSTVMPYNLNDGLEGEVYSTDGKAVGISLHLSGHGNLIIVERHFKKEGDIRRLRHYLVRFMAEWDIRQLLENPRAFRIIVRGFVHLCEQQRSEARRRADAWITPMHEILIGQRIADENAGLVPRVEDVFNFSK